jgi:hypothetical protein
VRTTLIYGANNPVDGAVLEVILRKAAKIGAELGVPVPLPDDGHTLSQALLKAVMLRKGAKDAGRQVTFEFMQLDEAKEIEARWRDTAENAKKNWTVFAQRRLKPEAVLPEWHKTIAAVGGREDVQRFTNRALARLGSGLEALRRGFKAPLDALPEDVRERLASEGFAGTVMIDFSYPPAPRCKPIQRSHPLVSILADTLLEATLGSTIDEIGADPGVLGRVGCWVSANVTTRSIVALLRLRHQLVTPKAGRASTLLVEEATALAWGGSTTLLEGPDALALLAPEPFADPPAHVRDRAVTQAIQQLAERRAEIDAFAERRAQSLLADHRRVREAADARGSYNVKALIPADVIGLFVLLPRVD